MKEIKKKFTVCFLSSSHKGLIKRIMCNALSIPIHSSELEIFISVCI